MGIQKNRKGYRVHFDGWPISEDKDIREDDILKINEEALAIKAQIESLDPRHDGENGLALQANSADFDKNEKVLAYWSGQMYSGKIVDVNGKKENDKQYYISYHGWRPKSDEWVTKENVFKMTPTANAIKAHLKKLADDNKKRKSEKVEKRKSVKIEKLKSEINEKQKGNQQKKIKPSLGPHELNDLNLKEDQNDPIDDWLTNNLFNKKSKAVTKKVYTPQPTCANTEVDDIEVGSDLKQYASKRSLLKKIMDLEKQVEEYKCAQEYNFCTKCKRHYDGYKKEGK